MEDHLQETVAAVKALIAERRFEECESLIGASMLENPHSAVPHNLMGLMLEARDRHPEAMKHFRAAWALDPTYRPARWNMENFGAFLRTAPPAYTQSDCETFTQKYGKAGGRACM